MKVCVLACLVVAAAAAVEKRQHGNVFHDVREIAHCQQQPTELSCRHCCRTADLTVPLEETQCEMICDRTHPDRRQLGGIFTDVRHIAHCQEQRTEPLCDQCCREADLAFSVEERQCERLCHRNHPDTIHTTADVSDVREILQCQQQQTEALCDDCCRRADLALAIEERQCERICDRTHSDKRQLGGIFTDVRHIAHCQEQRTETLCDQCCREADLAFSVEERQCERLCHRNHPDTLHTTADVSDVREILQCQQQQTEALCDDCCRRADLALAIEERQCERICDRTHPDK